MSQVLHFWERGAPGCNETAPSLPQARPRLRPNRLFPSWATALQAAEKPLMDGVAATSYRHNSNGINPALAT
jgi:hypothetical protein